MQSSSIRSQPAWLKQREAEPHKRLCAQHSKGHQGKRARRKVQNFWDSEVSEGEFEH